MSKAIWTEVDFRLSVVRRWQVMPTIRQQTVAEHQHNVAKIAERLAVDVYGWSPNDPELLTLFRVARDHDDLEAIIGDPPSYTKPYINEEVMAQEFSGFLREPLYADPVDPTTMFIAKAADTIDAMIFLRVEISMGNRTVVGVLRDTERRFRVKCEGFDDGIAAWHAYQRVVDEMFGGNGQLTIEGFRFK